jgi:hypothetical protein
VALLPGRAETARAINAALHAGGSVSIAREPVNLNGSEWPAGTVVLDASAARSAAAKAAPGTPWTEVAAAPLSLERLKAPRVGIYKPLGPVLDEGWTRFVLEDYGFEPKTVELKTARAGNLNAAFDVIVLPDSPKEQLATGRPRREEGEMKYQPELPPEYVGGLEKEGAQALKHFVEAGGTLVALSAASEYVMDEFNVPVRNSLARVRGEEFGCPGSLLRAHVDAGHPVTYGLPASLAIFQDKPIAFETTLPGAEMERWVLASYPEDGRDVLLSGWIRGEERLVRRAAAVAMTYGKGRLVLLGFRPQHRAQTPATFPFLFNALYWSVMR